jgi:hypothetical protein
MCYENGQPAKKVKWVKVIFDGNLTFFLLATNSQQKKDGERCMLIVQLIWLPRDLKNSK